MTLTVVCLLAGQKYSPAYVERLRVATAHLGFRFVCASDSLFGDTTNLIPLIDKDASGWWHKLSLFHPAGAFGRIKGRILYLDLDVAIVGDLTDIASFPSDWAMHLDFQRPWKCASAVMLFEAGTLGWVWDAWRRDPVGIMRDHHGDQEFLDALQMAECRWRAHGVYCPHCDFLPQRWVRSYRMSSIEQPPEGSKIVCFHGQPKPHEARGWAGRYWNEMRQSVLQG